MAEVASAERSHYYTRMAAALLIPRMPLGYNLWGGMAYPLHFTTYNIEYSKYQLPNRLWYFSIRGGFLLHLVDYLDIAR
jgi:hypothetical protein